MKNIQNGTYLKTSFSSLEVMKESGVNWGQTCTYQLGLDSLIGENSILHFINSQLSYTQRNNLFYKTTTPENCISIAVIEESKGYSSLGDLKLFKQDIIFLDASTSLNYVIGGNQKIAILSVEISYLKKLNIYAQLKKWVNHKIIDSDDILISKMLLVLKKFEMMKKDEYEKIDSSILESSLLEIIISLLKVQVPTHTKLTKGEKVVLKIRDDLYKKMDEKISISQITQKYKISERTLQKSFQSLFGFSPSNFLRTLKLNHVYHELHMQENRDITVTRIAHKWGFSHMGRFASYYKKLFGELPSETLFKSSLKNSDLIEKCTIRTQEI